MSLYQRSVGHEGLFTQLGSAPAHFYALFTLFNADYLLPHLMPPAPIPNVRHFFIYILIFTSSCAPQLI